MLLLFPNIIVVSSKFFSSMNSDCALTLYLFPLVNETAEDTEGATELYCRMSQLHLQPFCCLVLPFGVPWSPSTIGYLPWSR